MNRHTATLFLSLCMLGVWAYHARTEQVSTPAATPWRDWQNGGINWSSCEPRRRTVAVKPGTAPWSNASAASSKSSITRSPRSRLTSARSSKLNRKSRTMHNDALAARCGTRGLHATHRTDAGTRTLGPKQAAALAGLAPFNVDSGAYRGKRKIRGGASVSVMPSTWPPQRLAAPIASRPSTQSCTGRQTQSSPSLQ